MRAILLAALAAAMLMSLELAASAQDRDQAPAAQNHGETTSGAAQKGAESRENKTSSQNAADEAQAGKHTRAMGKDTKSQSDIDSENRAK